MKNIIVLKDLPSNIVDEAIVILKAGSKVKDKVKKENNTIENIESTEDTSYEIAIKEAEFLVADYMKNLEKPKEDIAKTKSISAKYKKLKICSFFLGIVAVIRNSFGYCIIIYIIKTIISIFLNKYYGFFNCILAHLLNKIIFL